MTGRLLRGSGQAKTIDCPAKRIVPVIIAEALKKRFRNTTLDANMHYRSCLAFVMSGSSPDLKKGFVSSLEGGSALNAHFGAQGMPLTEGNLYVSESVNQNLSSTLGCCFCDFVF